MLTTLFARYVDATLEHCRRNFKYVVPVPTISQVMSICKILESILPQVSMNVPLSGAAAPNQGVQQAWPALCCSDVWEGLSDPLPDYVPLLWTRWRLAATVTWHPAGDCAWRPTTRQEAAGISVRLCLCVGLWWLHAGGQGVRLPHPVQQVVGVGVEERSVS